MSVSVRVFQNISCSSDRRTFLKTFGAATSTVMLSNLVGCELATSPPSSTTHPSHLVRFGHTDLFVSKLCQGTAFRTHLSREGGNAEAHKLLRHCVDIGINFFDTAESYGWGGSETALGRGISGLRDKVIIVTKAAPGSESGEPLIFTKEILTKKVEGSLKRLATDYIDLYLLHGPDKSTPSDERQVSSSKSSTQKHMQEIADIMDGLVRSGKIRHWGVSNHLSKQVGELVKLGMRPEKFRMAGLEDYYNIVAGPRRDFMVNELFPLINKGNLGLMAFSPLGEGRLVPGRKVEEGSPLIETIKILDEVAIELGVSRPQICVAWVASHPEVTSVLSGAEKPEHVEENFKGTELQLPAEVLRKLNTAANDYTTRVAQQKTESS